MDAAKKLRAALARERAAGRGIGKQGFGQGLKQKVVSYLRCERAKGRAVSELVAAIGISHPTYYAWVGAVAPRRKKAFCQIAELPVAKAQTSNATDAMAQSGVAQSCAVSSRIVVMGPGGVAVLGLSVSDVAELVRRLGC